MLRRSRVGYRNTTIGAEPQHEMPPRPLAMLLPVERKPTSIALLTNDHVTDRALRTVKKVAAEV
jgi:hypothetical protein